MFDRRHFLLVSAWLFAAAVRVPVSLAQGKRPLNHGDYDGWRSIVGQRLSNDGKFLVYGLFPQEADGEVVIRNLVTGKEQREPAGLRPAPTPPAPDQEGPPPEARGAVLGFSADSKTVVFSTFPAKAESDKAKKDKKPAPKDGKEDAIGIQGHSWGGYQIACMVTQTKRFRALAAGAPVANMISAYDGIRWGTGIPRQFQYERTQSRIGGSIWQYPTRFIEHSPIFWADRVRTPVMLLHNDGDDAVPWYQGVEFYLALRRLGKEVYLFDYNGEPHGLRRRPNQKDYTIRLQQYFDHYLKGAPAPAWMEKGVPYIERERTELSTMGDKK